MSLLIISDNLRYRLDVQGFLEEIYGTIDVSYRDGISRIDKVHETRNNPPGYGYRLLSSIVNSPIEVRITEPPRGSSYIQKRTYVTMPYLYYYRLYPEQTKIVDINNIIEEVLRLRNVENPTARQIERVRSLIERYNIYMNEIEPQRLPLGEMVNGRRRLTDAVVRRFLEFFPSYHKDKLLSFRNVYQTRVDGWHRIRDNKNQTKNINKRISNGEGCPCQIVINFPVENNPYPEVTEYIEENRDEYEQRKREIENIKAENDQIWLRNIQAERAYYRIEENRRRRDNYYNDMERRLAVIMENEPRLDTLRRLRLRYIRQHEQALERRRLELQGIINPRGPEIAGNINNNADQAQHLPPPQ